ncbi:MAG: PQQ-binding-like beta-propeller repeat protein [Planctomycetota bacterium]
MNRSVSPRPPIQKTLSFIRKAALVVWAGLTSTSLALAEDTSPEDTSTQDTIDWPSFRGTKANGIATGSPLPTRWDATSQPTSGIHWRTQVPGLGHSSPTIVGDQIYLTTAISVTGDAPLNIGRNGGIKAAQDSGPQSWVVLCYDKNTGTELWRRTATTGAPQATRHAKATHANSTVAVANDRVVASFGSEGTYCYDRNGELIWETDLGLIDISKYGIGWGYASSPTIHEDRVVLVCDDPNHPFVVALNLSDGKEVWRTDRLGDSERNWSSALIHDDGGTLKRIDEEHSDGAETSAQVIVNGWPWIVAYDLEDGSERWRIRGGGDNPVPTPFVANGLIYITSAHGDESPIYAIRPDASGNLTESLETSHDSVVWQVRRGGAYMSTPVVHDGRLYLGNTNGVLRCYDAASGDKVYEKRLGRGASIIASLVAGDGKVFCASENGSVYVVRSGAEFEVIAENPMGEACFASPAISGDTMFIRTSASLYAIRTPGDTDSE